MKKEQIKAMSWLVNRLQRKYKIPAKTTKEVLGAISDLAWDWENSKYDLYGVQLEEMLLQLGITRNPAREDER